MIVGINRNNRRWSWLTGVLLVLVALSVWLGSVMKAVHSRQAAIVAAERFLGPEAVTYSAEGPGLIRWMLGGRLVSRFLVFDIDADMRKRLAANFPEAQLELIEVPRKDRSFLNDKRRTREVLSTHADLGYKVRFVLPTGYRGVFKISEGKHRQNHDSPPTGEYTYVIPHSGYLRTPTILPLISRFHCRAEYEDGTSLGIDGPGDQCALRRLPFEVDEDFRAIVGTDGDVSTWKSDHRDWFKIEATPPSP